MNELIHSLLNLDETLKVICQDYGVWTYAILFLIIFCETGLIVTPFLPGDSLLFAVGALAAEKTLDLLTCMGLLFVAAVIGDSLNYWTGRKLGRGVFKPEARILKTRHLDRTEAFYAKYGPKAIILARFVPIVRTMAPFVAGLGKMHYPRFLGFDLLGGAFWVGSMIGAGYLFGGLPWVQEHFEVVVLAIIFVSLLPALVEIVRAKMGQPTVSGQL